MATVSCPTAQACTLGAPRNVKFKAGGKQWSAKVIAPHWILPGKSGKVTVKVMNVGIAAVFVDSELFSATTYSRRCERLHAVWRWWGGPPSP